MTDFNRLQALSGKNPAQEKLNALKNDRTKIDEAYTIAFDAVKNDRQIDEGLWDNLTAALGTVSQVGKIGSQAAVDAAKKVSAQVKTIYQDKKAQIELKNLVNTMRKILPMLGNMQDKSPTIMKLDKMVAKEFDIMYQIFTKTIQSLASRMAIKEGIELNQSAMKDLMIAEGLLDETSIRLDEALKNNYGDISKVLKLNEFANATSKMAFISTHSELKEGTLVFDTGIKGINYLGEEVTGSKFIFKIKKSGQVYAEVKGIYQESNVPQVYRLGESIEGETQVDVYKKALVNVAQRYEKKIARHPHELALMKSQYHEWNSSVAKFNGGADSIEDDK